MAKFLSNTELYQTLMEKSLAAKETLWVCSPALGLGAHRVFSQEILKTPPADIRFVFPINDFAVKEGKVNPYEIQYLMEHFKGICIKSHENFHSNIYIFDNSALITSATLTEEAFESNIETGILLEGVEVEEVKNFFNQNLWNTSKSVGELKKYKLIWNLARKTAKKGSPKKSKPHTQIKEWTNTYINTWYIGVSKWISKKTEHKIKKETSWENNLSVLGDVGYQAFTHLKLGDLAYLADFTKRGKIEVQLVHVIDKAKVETDEGDLHCAYETEKNYSLDREKFYEMLKNANIKPKTETVLNDEQLKLVVDVVSSIKRKRRAKVKNKIKS
jgi:hypothetical protein